MGRAQPANGPESISSSLRTDTEEVAAPREHRRAGPDRPAAGASRAAGSSRAIEQSPAAEPLPGLAAPMLAIAGPAPTGPGWGFEFKWDGVRAVVYHQPPGVRVVSRNDRDITASYPELAEVGTLLPGRTAVLDGEIVALDADGRPSFAQLQRRMHLTDPPPSLLAAVPVLYYVFDVLHLDGADTMHLPYARRRRLLEDLSLDGRTVRTPQTPPYADAAQMLAAARARGLEGVVAKRLDSPYQSGRRSPSWVKTPLWRTQSVVLIGYRPGEGRRAGTVGSLVLAVSEPDGTLSYAGGVGTGFTDAMLDDLRRRLDPLRRATSPGVAVPREYARGVRWVEPRLVGEVAYRTFSPDGRMRHPSWRGLRPDQGVADTLRDATAPATRVEGAMGTPDGAWRVEAVRRGTSHWYRLVHGDNVVDGLAIGDVERLLRRAGVDLGQLTEVHPAA